MIKRYIVIAAFLGFNVALIYLIIKHDQIIEFKLAFKEVLGLSQYQKLQNDKTLLLIDQYAFDHIDRRDLIDSIQNFINLNSDHIETSDDFKKNAFNTPFVLQRILEVFLDKTTDKPDLSCTPRAWAMRRILSFYNIDSKIICLYFKGSHGIRSHTFLEVWNEYSNRWEVRDPDLNVVYKNKLGANLSIFQMKKMVERGDTVYQTRDELSGAAITYLNMNEAEKFALIRFDFLRTKYQNGQIFIDQDFWTMKDTIYDQSRGKKMSLESYFNKEDILIQY